MVFDLFILVYYLHYIHNMKIERKSGLFDISTYFIVSVKEIDWLMALGLM